MDRSQAEDYARWFRCLADATRLQLLRQLATTARPMTIGELVQRLGVGQSTISGHVRRLAAEDFVTVQRQGTTTYVTVNADCLTALPEAAAAVMARDDPAVAVMTGDMPAGEGDAR